MARLIPQKQIEEINIFKDNVSVKKSVFISGSLIVSQSINIGSELTTPQSITGSVQITGSLEIDGTLSFANANNRLDATASFADESIDTQKFGGILPEKFGESESTLYVSSTNGSDENDGKTPQFPLRTVKKAAKIATDGDDGRYGLPTGSLFSGFAIKIDAGTYLEDNPIELPKNTTVWGSGLRVTKVLAKNENEDLFWVNSGNYISEMTFGNLRVFPSVDISETGFAVAFAPNAFITTSPYIQNCSMISNQENSFLEAYEDIPAGGGGLNVDGNKIHPNSPLASMVLDAYTQIAPNGVGCQVVGRGFIQLVSFFTNFSAYSVKVVDGGQAVLLNSNTSFGDYGMYASGSRFITGSGGNGDAFFNVQNNYSIIVDTIKNGLTSIPDLVPTTFEGRRLTDPNEVPQYFVSEDSTIDVADRVKSDFRIVSSIVEDGITDVPKLLAKSGKGGYGPESLYNVGSKTQYVNEVTASNTDVQLMDTNFDIILDIIERGNVATSSYVQADNVSSSIKTTDTSQYSTFAVQSTTNENIVERFDTVISIIENGLTTSPIVSSSTMVGYTFTDTTIYETDITSSLETIQSVSSSFSLVYDILANGTGSLPTTVLSSSVENPSVDVQNAYTLLIENIPFIQDETIAYLSSSWSEHPYNQETCKRDVGFIISSSAHDLLFGGNEESIRSGVFYYQFPSNATTTEKDPTLTGVKYASELAINILDGKVFSEAPSELDNAYDVIYQNKDFVREETIAYISSSWSEFEYSDTKCKRDIGYILDAVATDIHYGGNERSVIAGEFYYQYPSLAIVNNRTTGQLQQTLDAVKYAKRITQKLANNETFILPSASVLAAVNLIKENRSLIQNETTTYIDTQYPNFSYDRVKCRRDVGYIVDNVITDLLYGGNERSELAGLYYFKFPSIANTTQLEETKEAIRYTKEFTKAIAQSIVLETPQVILNVDGNIRATLFEPTTGSISATDSEVQIVSQSFGIIEDIIRYGTDSVLSSIAGNSEDYIWNLENPLNVSGIAQIESTDVATSNTTNLVTSSFDTVIKIIQSGSSITTEETIGTDSKGNPISTVGIPKSSYGSNLVKTTIGTTIPSDITLVKNTEDGIKFGNNVQTTSSLSIGSTNINKVSSSFSIVSDIIRYGTSGSLSVSGSSDASTYFEVVTLSEGGYNIAKTQIQKFDDVDGRVLGENTGSFDDSVKDPTLTLKRGDLYTFSVNSLTNINSIQIETEPFYITTNRSTDSKYRYNNGVTNNGSTFGTITFIVPFDAPDILFYVNGNDVNASGVINIVDTLPLSDTQKYIDIPSLGSFEVTTNNIDGIKVSNLNQYTSETSASISESIEVSSSFATVIDILSNGVGNIPTITKNTSGNIKKTIFTQYTSSVASTDGIINTITSSFDNVVNIIQNGTGSIPSLIENTTDLIKVGSIAQITSSLSGSSVEVSNVSSSFGIVLDILTNGLDSLPIEISNVTASIKRTDTPQYISASSAGEVEVTKISSSFSIVTDIVTNGTGSLPTLIYNTTENIKVNSTQQFTGSLSGSLEDINFISSSISIVTNLITNGAFGAGAATDYVSAVTTDSTLAAYEIIKENIDFIQDETISYLSSSWSTASYDESKCRRDVGLIISGAAEDLLFNEKSASLVNGKFYYEFPSQAQGAQLNQTLDGIFYASKLAQELVQNTIFVTASSERIITSELLKENTEFIQNETIAYLSSSWSEYDYNQITCKRDVGHILDAVATDIIYGGNERSVNAGEFYYQYPSTATTTQLKQTLDGINYANRLAQSIVQNVEFQFPSADVSSSFDLIRSNIDFVKEETITYLSSSWSTFEYNETTCKRDVGHIVDAVVTDLFYGGNERSRNAGEFYYLYPSAATGSQFNQTYDGVNYARRLVENIVDGNQFAIAPFSRTNGYELLFNNKELIQNEVTEYISSSWSDFVYNDVTCRRDVGYIVDAVATDLLYGGNERSNNAGEFYYLYPSTATTSQLDPTVDGVKYAKNLSIELLQNNIFETASNQTIEVTNLISQNRNLIQTETIEFLSSSWSGFEYDDVKCKRDVGYILDAVTTDFYYGGNERSSNAGEFYYLFPSQATGSQINQTVDGIKYAQRLTNKVINNVTLVSASIERQTAHSLLFDNKSLIQNEVISFMSSSWSNFEYNDVKCRRDVGYIVDAVATDVLYGGNERSVTAGEFYYKYPSEATTVQSDQTITGILHAAGLANKIVQSTLLINASSEKLATYNTMLDNKALIQFNVTEFIDQTYPYFTYDRVKCKRDIGYIIDAVATDLVWGGNERSIVAGDYYYRYPSKTTTLELTETTDAIEYANLLVNKLITNIELVVPTITKNTNSNIRFNDTEQYSGSLSISGSNITNISSSFEMVSGIITDGIKSFTPTTATYEPSNGDFVMTIPSHTLTPTNGIYIKPESFVFTCDMDGNRSEHKLPSIGQPAYNNRLGIQSVTDNTVTVNVGKSGPNVEFNPTTASYDPSNGEFVVTVGTHSLSVGEGIVMKPQSFAFTCDMDDNQSTKSYPRVGIDPFAVRSLPITSVTDTTLTFNVGASGPNKTFTPTNADYNALTGDMILTVSESFGLGVGRSVVLENQSIAFTCDMDSDTTTHSYPRLGSDPYAGKSIEITSVGTTQHTVSDSTYTPSSGLVSLTISEHGFSNGDYIKLSDNSLTFSCLLDGNVVGKSYPRAGTDFPSGRWLEISNVTTNSFEINIGSSSYDTPHTFVSAVSNGLERQDGTFTINVGNAGSASGSIHTFVSASNEAVKHLPQSVHTFVSASSGAVKHLPQSLHTFKRTDGNSISTLPYEVRSIDSLIKVTNATQTTSSLSGGDTQVGIVSASINMITDIIRLGSDSIPFTIAKHFQTSELDNPQNITIGSYVTASGAYVVTNELEIVSSSFNQINDIIENGTGSLPTLVSNVNSNIKATDANQYTSLVTGSSVEISIVSDRAGLVENIVTNGIDVIPTMVSNNTNISNLIKVGNIEQYVSASGADKIQSKIVSSSFGMVINGLTNGTGSLPTITDYSELVDAPKTVLAYNLIKENIEFIKEETILFMSSSWSTFVYDEEKCRRDVGLIVSGAAEDLIWNSNSASVVNTKFYYEFPSAATGSQLNQTVTAIKYAGNLVQNIVRNYEYTTASAEVSASYDLLIANKEFIQNETIEFVSSSWSGFDYPELTCKRDVGYILDAVATDLLYGGNERTITAGKYYYDYPSAAIVGGVPSVSQQKDPTVTAINYVKGLSTELVGGNIFVTSSNEIDFVYDSVKLNRGFIQNETVAFVNAKYPNLQYNEVSCSRDTGFIVDAVITDLKYGGNQRTLTAGEFYYRFPSKATNVQLGETTDAVTYISDLVNEIVLQNTLTIPTLTENSENAIKTTSETQTLGSGTTEVSVLNAVSSSFGIVMDIVVNGTGSLPITSEYTSSIGDSETLEAYSLLKSNIPFIQSETIAYLSSSWSEASYNESSCSRDIGSIVSGAAEDLLFGSVSSSVFNGKYYYDFPSQAQGTQLNQTLDGIQYASRLANNIIQSVTYVTSSIENVTSHNLIRDNKEFIQSESIAYISSSWSSFGYNEETCKRDVGYIVDAVSTDILYGGNERSVTAGDFYYRYPSNATTSELEPTTTGIEYAGDLVEKLIVNKIFVSPSVERIAGNETILKNREFIQTEVISYVSSSWSNFEYNEASCSRDTGYILDAVATDFLYGGNERSRTAGEFYYKYPSSATVAGDTSPNVNAQLYPTLDGIKYASGISQELVQNIEFVTASNEASSSWNSLRENKEFIQNEVIAYVSSSWSGVFYNEDKCKRDVGHLIDATATDLYYGGNERSVNAGSFYYLFPSSATAKGVPSTTSQLDPTVDGIRYAGNLSTKVIKNETFLQPSASVLVGADLLVGNKTFIQKETIAFLSSSWSEFEYNEASCSRDLGYIIDAVRTDLVYGGNERSVQAGIFYYYIPSVATTEQKPQTTDGIDFAKGLSEKVILKEQLTRAPFLTQQSVDYLRASKKQLQSIAISYTNAAFPDFEYNEDKCYRDTGFILDAIATDLYYGGNERSITAAESYYTGVYGSAAEVINNQQYETADVNRYLRTQFQRIVRNSPLEEFGSLIITTGHDFSYAGAGVTYKALPPNQGGAGVPDPTKEITEIAGGRVFFTSGNELGDFRIGTGLVINQATGTLQGRTFSRSLFSLVTPFSLALEG